MDDLISRQAAIGRAVEIPLFGKPVKVVAVSELEALPSAQPYALDEWCDTCKEYDHEKHCCPRYNRVIRDALKMRKRGKWIYNTAQ